MQNKAGDVFGYFTVLSFQDLNEWFSEEIDILFSPECLYKKIIT